MERTGHTMEAVKILASHQHMRTSALRNRFAIVIASSSLLVLAASSQEVKKKLPGEDWVSLFNGRDLTGWVKVGQESWTVEDGVIHGRGLTKDYGYLQTEKSFRDFQLSLRF